MASSAELLLKVVGSHGVMKTLWCLSTAAFSKNTAEFITKHNLSTYSFNFVKLSCFVTIASISLECWKYDTNVLTNLLNSQIKAENIVLCDAIIAIFWNVFLLKNLLPSEYLTSMSSIAIASEQKTNQIDYKIPNNSSNNKNIPVKDFLKSAVTNSFSQQNTKPTTEQSISLSNSHSKVFASPYSFITSTSFIIGYTAAHYITAHLFAKSDYKIPNMPNDDDGYAMRFKTYQALQGVCATVTHIALIFIWPNEENEVIKSIISQIAGDVLATGGILLYNS